MACTVANGCDRTGYVSQGAARLQLQYPRRAGLARLLLDFSEQPVVIGSRVWAARGGFAGSP